jgi:hypothetical protein
LASSGGGVDGDSGEKWTTARVARTLWIAARVLAAAAGRNDNSNDLTVETKLSSFSSSSTTKSSG